MFGFGQIIVRVRAPRIQDEYSNAATRPDWAHAVETRMSGFAIAPGASVETQTVNREQVVTDPTLYGPLGADIVATDRVRDAYGTTWEVVGNRSDWRSPFSGWEAGATWPLRRVEG